MNKYFLALFALLLTAFPLSLQAKTVSCGEDCVSNETGGVGKPTAVGMSMSDFYHAAGDACLDSNVIRIGDEKSCDSAIGVCKQTFIKCVVDHGCKLDLGYYGDWFECTQETMDACEDKAQETHGAEIDEACMTKKAETPTLDATETFHANAQMNAELAEGNTWVGTPQDNTWPGTETVCGNGIKEDGEQCDDGNQDELDGCTSACEVEFHYNGPQTPDLTVDPQTPDKESLTDGGNSLDDGGVDPSVGNVLVAASGSGCSLQSVAGTSSAFNYLALLFGLLPLAPTMIRKLF